MGRKIPTRRHMGVRDPLKQQADRFALIKDKINNPPEKQDFQKVSHSLARFIKLKEEAKQNIGKKKQKFKPTPVSNEDKPENYKKIKGKKTEHRNDKELSDIKQRKGEDDRHYLRRVNRETRDSLQEAKFEAKYGVEVLRDKKTGEIKVKKRPANEIDELIKHNQQKHKGGKAKTPAIVITPEERKKLVKEMIKKKKVKAEEVKPVIKEFKRDEFKFGEVVHEPPQLATPRYAKKVETVPRPGRKSLLLHSVIEEHSKPAANVPKSKVQPVAIKKGSSKAIGTLKGKRKDLSMAMRAMIDNEQSNVVQLYKELKKTKRLENASA